MHSYHVIRTPARRFVHSFFLRGGQITWNLYTIKNGIIFVLLRRFIVNRMKFDKKREASLLCRRVFLRYNCVRPRLCILGKTSQRNNTETVAKRFNTKPGVFLPPLLFDNSSYQQWISVIWNKRAAVQVLNWKCISRSYRPVTTDLIMREQQSTLLRASQRGSDVKDGTGVEGVVGHEHISRTSFVDRIHTQKQ